MRSCLLRLAGSAPLLVGLPALADDASTAALQLSAGAASFTLPRFPGGQRSRTIYFPFLDAEYANRFYSSASDLIGVYAYKSDTLQTGAALELDPTRRLVQDDARLTGLGNVKDTARVKLFASKTIYFLTVEENLASDILGRGQGTLAQTNLWLTAPLSKTFTVNVGPGVTWSDHRYMNSFFTVSTAVAAHSAFLTAYSAHAGISDLRINGLAEWQPTAHYRLGVLAYVAHLQGDAAASPVAMQRAQRTIMAWLAYKFE